MESCALVTLLLLYINLVVNGVPLPPEINHPPAFGQNQLLTNIAAGEISSEGVGRVSQTPLSSHNETGVSPFPSIESSDNQNVAFMYSNPSFPFHFVPPPVRIPPASQTHNFRFTMAGRANAFVPNYFVMNPVYSKVRVNNEGPNYKPSFGKSSEGVNKTISNMTLREEHLKWKQEMTEQMREKPVEETVTPVQNNIIIHTNDSTFIEHRGQPALFSLISGNISNNVQENIVNSTSENINNTHSTGPFSKNYQVFFNASGVDPNNIVLKPNEIRVMVTFRDKIGKKYRLPAIYNRRSLKFSANSLLSRGNENGTNNDTRKSNSTAKAIPAASTSTVNIVTLNTKEDWPPTEINSTTSELHSNNLTETTQFSTTVSSTTPFQAESSSTSYETTHFSSNIAHFPATESPEMIAMEKSFNESKKMVEDGNTSEVPPFLRDLITVIDERLEEIIRKVVAKYVAEMSVNNTSYGGGSAKAIPHRTISQQSLSDFDKLKSDKIEASNVSSSLQPIDEPGTHISPVKSNLKHTVRINLQDLINKTRAQADTNSKLDTPMTVRINLGELLKSSTTTTEDSHVPVTMKTQLIPINISQYLDDEATNKVPATTPLSAKKISLIPINISQYLNNPLESNAEAGSTKSKKANLIPINISQYFDDYDQASTSTTTVKKTDYVRINVSQYLDKPIESVKDASTSSSSSVRNNILPQLEPVLGKISEELSDGAERVRSELTFLAEDSADQLIKNVEDISGRVSEIAATTYRGALQTRDAMGGLFRKAVENLGDFVTNSLHDTVKTAFTTARSVGQFLRDLNANAMDGLLTQGEAVRALFENTIGDMGEATNKTVQVLNRVIENNRKTLSENNNKHK